VSYAYPDGREANSEIDFELHAGELFCLLGPNGAGKTTLLRQITGELRPQRGFVRVLGRDATLDAMRLRRDLGIIPQQVGLYDVLSVRQHIEHFARLKLLTGRRASAETERVLAECDLQELQHRRVGTLSVGQQRRVLVALALLGQPRVLLLDEPTVGLDPVARRRVWVTLRKQCREGRTILLTTHYLDEAEQLADRIGIIEHGRVVRLGSLQELFERVDKAYRVSELDPTSAQPRAHHYFDTLAEAHEYAQGQRLEAFMVSRISLEDVYVRLLGHSYQATAS